MRLRELRSRSRAEWRASRRCGASSVSKILGVSPFGGPWSVYVDQVDPRPESATDAQSRGMRWEPIVAYLYALEGDLEVQRPPAHTTYIGPESWASMTPDLFVYDGRVDEEGLAELKTDIQGEHLWGQSCTVQSWDDIDAALRAGRPLVRPDYAMQAHWQMWVVDAPWCDLAVLLPRYELRVFRLMRDRDFEGDLVDQVREWWSKHVLERRPPPADESADYRAWYGRQGASTALVRDVDAAWSSALEEHLELNRTIKLLEQRRMVVGNSLLALIGGDAGVRTSTFEAKVVRMPGRVTIDHEALLAERPDLAALVQRHTRAGDPFAYPRVSPAKRSRQ